MPLIQVKSQGELHVMNGASVIFDAKVTPVILPYVTNLPSTDARVAWWDGFLSSLVGAMAATVGEAKTAEICSDLYTRAKDFASDQAKERQSHN
jgi:hypothetical protein